MEFDLNTVREQPPQQHSFRILVVEDDILTLEMISLLLEDVGYYVLKASGVEEALTAAEQIHVDLVVSDIGLSDGDAFEMMRTLRRRFGIPGISVTGYVEEEAMREAGFVEHLTKPVDFDHLLRLVAKVRTSLCRVNTYEDFPHAA